MVNINYNSAFPDQVVPEEEKKSREYGLQVAQLAGVPNDVIKAAKVKLLELESKRQTPDSPQADLFQKVAEPSPLEAYLQQINPDDLTPKQAQDKLYQLIALL